jgi:hypothetical protein
MLREQAKPVEGVTVSDSETVPVNDPTGTTFIDVDPEFPLNIVRVDGLAENENLETTTSKSIECVIAEAESVSVVAVKVTV